MLTGCSRAEVAALIDAGEVLVGGAPVANRSAKVAPGDEVEVEVPDPRRRRPPRA